LIRQPATSSYDQRTTQKPTNPSSFLPLFQIKLHPSVDVVRWLVDLLVLGLYLSRRGSIAVVPNLQMVVFPPTIDLIDWRNGRPL